MKNTVNIKPEFANQVLEFLIPQSLPFYLELYVKECIEILANCDYLDKQIAQSLISLISTNLLVDNVNLFISLKSKQTFDNFVFVNLKTLMQEKLHEMYVDKSNRLDLLNFNSLSNCISINIEILLNELKIELLKLERFLRRKSIEMNSANCPIQIQANATQELLNQITVLSPIYTKLSFAQPILGSSEIFNEFFVKEVATKLKSKLNIQFSYLINKAAPDTLSSISIFDLIKTYQLVCQLSNLLNQIIKSIDCSKLSVKYNLDEVKSYNVIYSAEICANNNKLSLVANYCQNTSFVTFNYLFSILIKDLYLSTKYLSYFNASFK